MCKRGQVTIFIIIAIVLIALVAVFFMFRDSIFNVSVRSSDPIYLYVENCVRETGEDGILYVIQNGGYLYSPDLSTSDGLPYYYYEGKAYIPTLERIENEISSYMEAALPYCTDNFANFPDFNISEGEIESSVSINSNEVIFSVKYSIIIKKGETTKQFTDFNNIKIKSRISSMYDSINEIMKNQGQEGLCLSCISDILEEEGFKLDLVSTGEGMIFSVIDEHSKIKEVPVGWRFASKYE